jgi:predicted O-linked N-acetylglucosamine transferase (SPINDLY family)
LPSNVGSSAFKNARLRKLALKQAEILFPVAVQAYREGRHPQAQALCRQILNDLPDHFDAWRLLGVSEADSSHFEEAVAALRRATALNSRSSEAHANLGWSLLRLGQYQEARASLERAITLDPNFPTALTNLGTTLMHLGRYDEAIAAHDRAIALKPDYGDAHCSRGTALLLANQNEEAVRSFDRALALQPRHLPALHGKGLAYLNLRNFDQALATQNAALSIKPDTAVVLTQRARVFQHLGQFDKADADFDAALAVAPHLEPALHGKATLSALVGRMAPALAACQKLLALNPNSATALSVLGSCLLLQGDAAAAIQLFDRALAVEPDHADAITRKIWALDFLPDAGFVEEQAARNYWWNAVGSHIPRLHPAGRELDPDRRLVVGYVSSDFRGHSAALAFIPILQHHNRNQFQIIAYSCSPQQDDVTDRCHKTVDRWVEAWRLSDDRLAELIQADKVDILVDLSGHSAGDRLGVFARKPAPVQVTAVGNVNGTGLPAIDYLLADSVVIPQSVRHLFAEKVYDLPALITIEPLPNIQPSPLPMLRNGFVTFGVFNRSYKISDLALTLWFRLMQALPGSIIVVKNSSMSDPPQRDGLIARFAAHGIPEERLRCIGTTSRPDHLAQFADIDISLDPFPQNGGISTWESLQMGVPVVTKLGNGGGARCGGAIVKAIGLDDWVADDDDGYLAIALRYASQPDRLAALRARLPELVANSAAGNCEVYTRHVEAGYRKFWRDYCAGATPE